MTTPTDSLSPKHLNARYLASGETLLRETLATPLFYFPGPVLALLITAFFDYAALTLRFAGIPSVPGLTWAFGSMPTFGQYAPVNYVTVTFVILTILALLWLAYRYLRWISTVYAVTSSRVIIQRGILSRDFDQIPIAQVRGIDIHQTFFDRVFQYGTLLISSEGGTRQTRLGNEAWKGIPHPFELQRAIETATQDLARANSSNPAGAVTVSPTPPSTPSVGRPKAT
jgi:hypothetical protein